MCECDHYKHKAAFLLQTYLNWLHAGMAFAFLGHNPELFSEDLLTVLSNLLCVQ